MAVEKDWSKTNHPFIPQLRARAKRLRGMKKAHALMGLSDAYWEEDEFVLALEAIEEARAISEQFGDLACVARCQESAAIILRDDALYGAALERAEAARKLWTDLGRLREAAECYSIMADLLALLGRRKEALASLANARAIFTELGHESEAAYCDRLRASISAAATNGAAGSADIELEPHERPVWGPLEALACKSCGFDPADFMWMGFATNGRLRIELYKHVLTRRYLNLDSQGRAYRSTPDGQFEPQELSEAMLHAYNGEMQLLDPSCDCLKSR